MIELSTERLLLRGWRAEDRAPFAALNADPEVMRCFPKTLSREESDALADRIEADLARDGWGLWALEERASGRFVGFTGLARPDFDALVSMTTPANLCSQAVMRRLGMTRDPAEDFDHSRLAHGHPLRRHMLFRLRRPSTLDR